MKTRELNFDNYRLSNNPSLINLNEEYIVESEELGAFIRNYDYGSLPSEIKGRKVKVVSSDKKRIIFTLSHKNNLDKPLKHKYILDRIYIKNSFLSLIKTSTTDTDKIKDIKGNSYSPSELYITVDGFCKLEDIIVVNDRLYYKESQKLTKCYLSGEIITKHNAKIIAVDLVIKDDTFISHKPVKIKHTYNIIEVIDSKNQILFLQDSDYIISKYNIVESVKDGKFYISKNVAKKLAKQKFWSSFNRSSISYKESSSYIPEHLNYTFGVEIETCKGYIPNRIKNKFNWSCTKDMSINSNPDNPVRSTAGSGGEYVTGVLKGDRGFLHLRDIMKELNKRCEVNRTCGVHVHIGNIEFTKQTTVLLYYLLQILESEIKLMLPPSRNNNEFARNMKKIISNIPNEKVSKAEFDFFISKMYNYIFKVIGMSSDIDKSSQRYNKYKSHPRGHRMGYDKKTPRYWWVNLVPSLFNTRSSRPILSSLRRIYKSTASHTIEFRNHHATLDYNKVWNWILICMAIVNTAESGIGPIRRGEIKTLNDVIDFTYKRNAEPLKKYISDRKQFFNNSNSEQLEYKTEFETCL